MGKQRGKNEPALKYLLISIAIFFVALAASSLSNVLFRAIQMPDSQVSIMADMISGVIAAIAAGLVLFQLKESEKERIRQIDIEEASFILQYNQTFIQDPNMSEVESLLEEQAHYGRIEPIITNENRQKFVNYLVYLEGLAPLILRGVLSLDHIDDLFAYRFYLAVNNPEVQEKELKKFAGDYRGCFKLYKEWTAYRKNEGLDILLNESALDGWEDFSKYAA